ncbi:MAG: hypothetical protein ACLUD2_05225 [Clostridium sp.]
MLERSEKPPVSPGTSELAWLEQNLFRYGTRFCTLQWGIRPEQYRPFSRPRILLVRSATSSMRSSGWHGREGPATGKIAVITGDLPGYGKEITHQFTQNQIPHFLDDKKNVSRRNCLVELILGLPEAVRQDFSYESVMRFLRTGLVSQERTMVDRLEKLWLWPWESAAESVSGRPGSGPTGVPGT